LVLAFVGIGFLFFAGLGISFGAGVFVGMQRVAHTHEPEVPAISASTPSLPAPKRDVPVHDRAVLAGCTSRDLEAIETTISAAIEVGAPTYNAGNFQGCFAAYESAARTLESTLPKACRGPTKALATGRGNAAATASPADKAWAMRDAFDGLLDVIERTR
jgi:hypothetical protein